MKLPNIVVPEYTLVLPLSDKKIKFRSFLSKEEKILLMAIENFNNKESPEYGRPETIIDATMQIAQNCVLTTGIEVNKLPTVDIEYLFLHIRKKSIGEKIEIIVNHNHEGCQHKNKVEVDLDKTQLKKHTNHTNKIQIDNNSGIILKYPTMNNTLKVSDSKTESFYDVIVNSIDKVYNGEDFSDAESFTRKELTEWVEQFPPNIMRQFNVFFDTMPYLLTEIKYTCAGCGKDEVMEVKGTSDFFI